MGSFNEVRATSVLDIEEIFRRDQNTPKYLNCTCTIGRLSHAGCFFVDFRV